MPTSTCRKGIQLKAVLKARPATPSHLRLRALPLLGQSTAQMTYAQDVSSISRTQVNVNVLYVDLM